MAGESFQDLFGDDGCAFDERGSVRGSCGSVGIVAEFLGEG